MGISKTGGTRARLRGRVGSEVYSIGRDDLGRKQQVVKALPEQVANPQSSTQMKTRCIMSTCQQAKSAMRVIVDHSFDKVATPLANLSRFVSFNAKLIRADVNINPISDNVFGLNKYREKGLKQGAWLVSEGYAQPMQFDESAIPEGYYNIPLSGSGLTKTQLMSEIGLGVQDFVTFVVITDDGDFLYQRFRFNPSVAADTVITNDVLDELLLTEGNVHFGVALVNGNISWNLLPYKNNTGVIVSRKFNSGYRHSSSQMYCAPGRSVPYSEAIETYPLGKVNYLNGGDIAGRAEEGGGEEPVLDYPVITSMKANGSSLAENSKSYGDSSKYDMLLSWTYNKVPFLDGCRIVIYSSSSFNVGEVIDSGKILMATTISDSVLSWNAVNANPDNDVHYPLLVDESNKVLQYWAGWGRPWDFDTGA